MKQLIQKLCERNRDTYNEWVMSTGGDKGNILDQITQQTAETVLSAVVEIDCTQILAELTEVLNTDNGHCTDKKCEYCSTHNEARRDFKQSITSYFKGV